MRVLFICLAKQGFYDGYVHRIASLRSGLESLGAKTVMLYLGDLPFKKPFLISPVNVPVLRKFFDDFDYIHAGNTGAAYLMNLARVGKRTDTKVIYDVHDNLAEEARLNYRGGPGLKNGFHYFQYSVMEKIASKHSDYFAVCSETFRDRYLRSGVDRERIRIVPNGVNVDIFKPRGTPENDVFTVAYVGRFQKREGIARLLEAARLLKDQRVRIRVIGLEKGARKALEEQYGNIEFMDFRSFTELVDRLSSSDGLIVPGMRHQAPEAFPGKFAEYIACGVPVIVTDAGDEGMTRRYQCGLVCEDSAASVAAAVLKLKSYSCEERKEMGENGRRLAEDLLDYRKISRNYYEFLREAGHSRNVCTGRAGSGLSIQ